MNIRLRLASFVAATLLAVSCTTTTKPLAEPTLIPMPVEATLGEGALQVSNTATIRIDSGADVLLPLLQLALPGVEFSSVAEGALIDITIGEATGLGAEAYTLDVTAEGVRIKAGSLQGARYAVQTLRQLTDDEKRIHLASINDEPRFGYRGIMLDVSRHYVSTGYLKGLLDEMARLKLNTFHWHLVDGGGWRMESKAYPLLTKKAAFRTQSDWDKWWSGMDRQFVDEGTPGAYGTYYTQDEIREIVAYAENLGITIIPEIEMPGHSNEIFAAYPELFCVSEYEHGISDVCIGNEETFKFFETILDETMALFPSKYIHIGGDEAAMNHWGACPKCQARMKAEGLKDLHELQSYMIRRIEQYLLSKGRKLIGWDEILMGGLAPEATVMSWRGEAGGIEAAKAGHDVIMTPNGFFYLDYYQSSAPDQPRANSSYVPLEKVYSYDPEPRGLTAEEHKHILGVQANLWTEYADTERDVDYMLYPRMLAVAEVAWTPQARRSWDDFRLRAERYTDAMLARGINAYTLNGITREIHATADGSAIEMTLRPERSDVEIRYTLDGSQPTASSTLYEAPIVTADSALVHYNLFRAGKPLYASAMNIRFARHLGMDGTLTYNGAKWHERYPAAGERTLIDGHRGTPTYADKLWQGFTTPLDVTIDLGAVKPVRRITAQFMQEREHWVYMPRFVEVWVSNDRQNWTSLGKYTSQTDEKITYPTFEDFYFTTSTEARYVRLYAENDRSEGHFIFTDEITVE